MSSAQEVAEVKTCTVTFYRATTGGVGVGADAVVDGEVVASLSAGGLLSYRPDMVSEIALVNGSVVRGIQALDSNGDPIDPATLDPREKPLLMLRAEDGGFATIEHEDLSIATATDRTTSAYAAAFTIGPSSIQCFWSVNGAARRWRCPDWGKFFATAPGDWAGSPPQTMGEGLNRVAAALAILGGPIA